MKPLVQSVLTAFDGSASPQAKGQLRATVRAPAVRAATEAAPQLVQQHHEPVVRLQLCEPQLAAGVHRPAVVATMERISMSCKERPRFVCTAQGTLETDRRQAQHV